MTLQVTEHIYLPSQRQAEKEAQLMNKCSGFPPIAWASVDGTYVKIRCPVIEEALYNCRKVGGHFKPEVFN